MRNFILILSCLFILILTTNISSGNDNDKNNNESTSSSTTTTASLIVCGVDGMVYIFNAWNGNLRGLFSSGSALVTSNQKEEDDSSSSSTSSSTTARRQRIVPGLDGHIYTFHSDNDSFDDEDGDDDDDDDYNDNIHLKVLPYSVKELIESPEILCKTFLSNYKSDNDNNNDEDCGIVTGSKQSTIFALDILSGNVEWAQQPSSSFKLSTTISNKNAIIIPPKQSPNHQSTTNTNYNKYQRTTNRGKKNPNVLLLQREDYFIHQVNIREGVEDWNVTVSNFQALDMFPGGKQRKSYTTTAGSGSLIDNKEYEKDGQTQENNIQDWKQPQRLSMIMNPRKREKESSSDEFHSFEDRMKAKSHQLSFPSIAFGRDGNSIIAINPSSHEFIWKRQLDTVIAAVYGAGGQGRDNQWISIRVVDEQDVSYTQKSDKEDNKGMLVPSRTEAEQELPYLEWDMTNGYPKQISRNEDYWIRMMQSYQNEMVAEEDRSKSLVAYHPVITTPSSLSTTTTRALSTNIIKAAKLGMHSSTLFVSSTILQPRPALLASTTNTEHVQLQEEEEAFLAIPQVYLTNTQFLQQNSYIVKTHMNKSFKTPQGLFLTWNIIFLLFISLCAGLYFGRMYYKHRFQHKLRMTLFESHSQDVSSTLKPNPPQRSHSMSAIVNYDIPRRERASSFPLREEQEPLPSTSSCKTLSHIPPSQPHATATPEVAMTNRDTTATTPAQTSSKKGNVIRMINGIPFVIQYSRYKSEFQEIHALGKGGFGTVYRCRNVVDEMEYAIKKIYISSQKEELTRVLREVKILALLNHPNVVRYYTAWLEVEEDDDTQHQQTDEEDKDPTNSSFTSSYIENSIMGTSFIQREMEQQLLLASSVRKDYHSNHLSSDSYSDSHITAGYTSSYNTNKRFSSNFLVGTNRITEEEDDDLGFNWDRNSSNTVSHGRIEDDNLLPKNCTTMTTSSKDESSNISEEEEEEEEDVSISNLDNTSQSVVAAAITQDKESSTTSFKQQQQTPQKSIATTKQRHVLYIQMQLCSQNTIADWIITMFSKINHKNNNKNNISPSVSNIPDVLKLFSQIINAVKHVHQMGLIHRDLKPFNCFLDKEGVVKIGDFGLSRELYEQENPNNNNTNEDPQEINTSTKSSTKIGCNYHPPDITAGIGTRSYASPEQMNGSDYDASTDIYSLGVMLFELCYPLNTAMEKYLVFKNLRKRIFPSQWNSTIAVTFPSLNSLLYTMLSPHPYERPTSAKIHDVITTLLNEYTIQSFNHSRSRIGGRNSNNKNHNSKTSQYDDNNSNNNNHHEDDNTHESLLIRIEAADEEENDTTKNQEGIVLQRTIQLIKEAILASSSCTTNQQPIANIVQYGLLRSQESNIIMEFEISVVTTNNDITLSSSKEEDEVDTLSNNGTGSKSTMNSCAIQNILSTLQASNEIKVVRQVNHK